MPRQTSLLEVLFFLFQKTRFDVCNFFDNETYYCIFGRVNFQGGYPNWKVKVLPLGDICVKLDRNLFYLPSLLSELCVAYSMVLSELLQSYIIEQAH